MTSKALAKIESNNAPDPEWKEIVDRIVDELGDQLPDSVIEATELMLAGWPTYKVAKKLGVKAATVRGWLEKYPTMAMAVANGRKLLSKWRMAKLEQQFITAVEKSEEILELDLSDREVNGKLVATVAQHARFVIGLFAGQQIDVNVKIEEGDQTLKAKADALSYIASEIVRQRESDEPIEAIYRVVDVEETNTMPMLDADGNPPHGELGVLDHNDGGTLCHICGSRFNLFSRHVSSVHHIKVKEYELIYMLELGSVRKMDESVNGKPDTSRD